MTAEQVAFEFVEFRGIDEAPRGTSMPHTSEASTMQPQGRCVPPPYREAHAWGLEAHVRDEADRRKPTSCLNGGMRKAHVDVCLCGSPVIAGWDDDVTALAASADPVAVDELQEVVAWLCGRASYAIIRGALWRRDEIPRRPGYHYPVVIEHRCEYTRSRYAL